MIGYSYTSEIMQHIEDCKALNLGTSEVALSIILGAARYDDDEVKGALKALPEDIKTEIKAEIEKFKGTKRYYVIASSGVTKDISDLMGRLSRLI